ncbi:MAG: hypothetical protein EP330_08095 [Deltaproteobacteria bacterium]|nr:MAG: hypothetical protein EP330_08095 [Deltaproteobacteria bacterium]
MRSVPSILLLSLVACGGGDAESPGASTAPKAEPAGAEVAAGRLCALFERVGESCEWSGNSAVVGEHTLLVSSEVTQEVKAGSALSMALTYTVTVDGKTQPGLIGRGSGGGASRSEALDKAADDWARVFGVSVVDAVRHTGQLAALQSLQDDQAPPPAFVHGDWVVYPGYTDLRGKRTEAKMIDIQAVLAILDPTISAFGEGVHGITIQFTRAGSAYSERACMLDGKESAEVCTLAETYGWPEGSYLLEQHLTFVGGELPEGVKARTTGDDE